MMTRSRLSAVALLGALVAAVALLSTGADLASAQAVRPDVEPVAGPWCGMSSDGGSVRFTVTDDRNYVEDVDVRTFKGDRFSNEGSTARPPEIKSGQFILRTTRDIVECERRVLPPQPGQPGTPGRCERAPCRPQPGRPQPGEQCRTVTVDVVLVRGRFQAVDSASGNYTFLADQNRRVYGQYIAWPASVAPCP